MTNVYTAEEVARHNRDEDLWIIFDGKVYDLTSFHKQHPGGEDVLLESAGQDGTERFNSIGHSMEAKNIRELFQIGELTSNADVTKPRTGLIVEKPEETKNPIRNEEVTKKGNNQDYPNLKNVDEKKRSSLIPILVTIFATTIYIFIYYFN